MRVSRYFMPILRDDPKEAEIVSHRLMLRSGMIRQEAAGSYSWLPLGLRVLKKIEHIVREEQNRAGAIEVLMPTLQSSDLWRKSGRYEVYGKEMLRFRDRHEREMLYGPTNEEMITDIVRQGVQSYRDLPRNLYHIQWKFRDEVRPRFGVMRGREFLMKDAYSFDVSAEAGQHSYNKMFVSYLRTFARMGLKAIPMRAETGPIGGDNSHEFLILAETGESAVYFDRDFYDMDWTSFDIDYDDVGRRLCGRRRLHRQICGDRRQARSRRVRAPRAGRAPAGRPRRGSRAHLLFRHQIFEAARVSTYRTRTAGRSPSSPAPTASACRGSPGAIIEASHDEAGIIWPEPVAPFDIGLINLKPGEARCDAACEKIYLTLERGRLRGALSRYRRAAGRQVRGDGPDRPAVAGHRRTARAEGRSCGSEEARLG